MERKLAAIFSTDVAGYSRLMGDDEEATIRTLTAYRAVISSLIQQYRGRVIDAPGDNLLAEFASVVDAVRCAVEIQHELKVKNAELPEHRQMRFRIGINLGDVIVEGERLYGDGVNIAARLESLALPGGICISRPVYDQVETKLALTYEDLGEQTVKNIAKPVRVYRVVLEDSASQSAKGKTQKAKVEDRRVGSAHQTWPLMVATGLLLIAATIGIVRYWPSSTPNSQLRTSDPRPLTPDPQAAPAALPLPDKPSIVVLPFDNMSKDPEQDYFSNGITEVLTSDLSRISSLFVIARNTAFTYKGKAVNMRDIGKELGVRYVLEGSVQKANDQVRIVTQLIDTTTGSHLWAERYDRPYKDIFAIQDEIVRKIVTTLKLQLGLREQGIFIHKTTENLEAYDYLLRGMEYYYRFTKEDNLHARRVFEQAVALDSQFAEAYARLGSTYHAESIFRWSQDAQTLDHAVTMGRRAVALDDSLPIVHAVLGQIYAQKGEYGQALAASERALALDPNSDESYARRAEVLNVLGRPEEALQSAQQALRLNPRSAGAALMNLGMAHYWMGNYTEAIAPLQTLIVRRPNFLGAYSLLSFSYMRQWISQQSHDPQTLTLATEAAQRAVTLNTAFPDAHLALGVNYLYQRQYEQAIAEMKQAITVDPSYAVGYSGLASALSYAGNSDEAVRMAEEALRHKPVVPDSHLFLVGMAYHVAGKPEEAIAPLQQFLRRYPHWLTAHLTLAAAYSELGKDAEAQAAAAEVLRINPNFSLAVHKERTPIKDPATLERYIAALRKAGLK
jgi:adenylate cyclase